MRAKKTMTEKTRHRVVTAKRPLWLHNACDYRVTDHRRVWCSDNGANDDTTHLPCILPSVAIVRSYCRTPVNALVSRRFYGFNVLLEPETSR